MLTLHARRAVQGGRIPAAPQQAVQLVVPSTGQRAPSDVHVQAVPPGVGVERPDLSTSILELERQLERFQAETRKKEAEMAILHHQYQEMKLFEQEQEQEHLQKHAPATSRSSDLDIDPRSMPQSFRANAGNGFSTSRLSEGDGPIVFSTGQHFEVEYDDTALTAAEAALINKAKVWAALHDDDDSAPSFRPQQQPTSQLSTRILAPSAVLSPRSWQPVSYEERSEVQQCVCKTVMNDLY